uniref:Single-stranded DNA-binding protein n=1 Tax=Panagrolaimus sp. JU765 TaxID=591449 RepID=A0AC34RSB4_9BILA
MFRNVANTLKPSISRIAGTRNVQFTAIQKANTEPDKKEVDRLFTSDTQPRRRRGLNLNRVELIGGVAENPVVRVSRNGSEYVTFGMFTNVEFRKQDGSFGEHTELHSIHVFGPQVNFVKNNVTKGSRVFLVGRLYYDGGDVRADGTRAPRTASITAETIAPLSRRALNQDDKKDSSF